MVELDITIFHLNTLTDLEALNMKKSYLLLSIFLLLSTSCQSAPDPELKQANDAMAQMAAARTLTKSCFFIIYPNGEASDFVNYLFSDLGASEWPIAFDEMEEEQLKAIGQPALPRNVTVSPFQRNQPNSKEIVLVADNSNRTILVQGYVAQSNAVAFEDQWPLGITQASEATRQLCQSNLEMGISSFSSEEHSPENLR